MKSIADRLLSNSALSIVGVLIAAAGVAPAFAAQPSHSAAQATHAITIDGDFSDWPGTDAAEADGQYAYFRVKLANAQSLSNASTSFELHVDFDGNAKTGLFEGINGELTPVGTDACVRFSPTKNYDGRGNTTAGKGHGVAVWIADTPINNNTSPTIKEIGHAAAGLISAPTIASNIYELRLDRAALIKAGCDAAGKGGTATWWAQTVDKDGKILATSSAQTIELKPVKSDSVPPELAETIPVCPKDAVRVMSYNVEMASPVKNPEPFARLFKAIRPDIVLVEEWEPGNFKKGEHEPRPGAAGIAAWFNQHVPLETGEWSVIDSAGWGVAVVTRFPVTRYGPERVSRTSDAPGDARSNDTAVRFAGAMIESPIGPIAAAALHLKCCGSPDTREEQTRLSEAKIINGLMADAGDKNVIRVIAGDFNLVGTRTPLETVASKIDLDGSDLFIVPTPTLGDNSIITWTDAESEFPPSRLDYMLVSDSTATPAQAFVFDTAHLSASALTRLNLQPTDSQGSDHRPLVVDLIKHK